MALLPSGSNDNGILALETPAFCLYIKGNRRNLEKAKLDEEDKGIYRVQCDEEATFLLGEEELIKGQMIEYRGVPLFFEQNHYELILEEKTDESVVIDHDSPLIRKGITPLYQGAKIQSGVFNFENEIGVTAFRFYRSGKLYACLEFEVYPTKLNYKRDYLRLRDDINNEIYNLTYDFYKRTYMQSGLIKEQHPSLTEFFSIFKEQFRALRQSLQLVIRYPHHELMKEERIEKYRYGKPVRPQTVRYLQKHPGQLVRKENSFYPKKVLQVHQENTFDVYENQVVKLMLSQLLRRLRDVKKLYGSLKREKDEKLLLFLEEQMTYFENLITGRFFGRVSQLNKPVQFSLVMQMSPVYSKFYRLYLMLQQGLSLAMDLFKISQKDVAQLYEYWCFIKLGSLLRADYQLISNSLLKANHKGLYVALCKGKESRMCFYSSKTKEYFELSYNRALRNLPTVAQKPDNMLVLRKEMSGVSYQYILDAKYKMDYEEIDGNLLAVPKEEDMNTLHRYRDAIVVSQEKNRFEHVVFGGIILFPGEEEKLYQKHRFYQSIEKVNIGGLPFLPSHTKLVQNFLEELLETSGHAQYHYLPKTNGIETYLIDQKIQEKDVLIGPVKDSHQLQMTLKYKLYHVPQKSLSVVNKAIKYIILYEPKNKEGLLPTGGIRYVGEVKSARAVKRKELAPLFPVKSGNEEEIYIVYDIKSWQCKKEVLLPDPMAPVRGPRYTNTTLLRYAKSLPELYIKDEAEFNLILQLRRSVTNLTLTMDQEEHLICKGEHICLRMNEAGNIIIQTQKGEQTFDRTVLNTSPRKIYKYLNG